MLPRAGDRSPFEDVPPREGFKSPLGHLLKDGKVRGELSVTISIPTRRPAERISAIRSMPHAPTCLRYCHSTSSATRLPARGFGSAVTDVGPGEVRLKPSSPGC